MCSGMKYLARVGTHHYIWISRVDALFFCRVTFAGFQCHDFVVMVLSHILWTKYLMQRFISGSFYSRLGTKIK